MILDEGEVKSPKKKKLLLGGELNPGLPRNYQEMTGGNTNHYTTGDYIFVAIVHDINHFSANR
jgi:hypothetical protein